MGRIAIALIMLLPVSGFCQKPVVYQGGVVNGASFAKAGTPSSAIGGGTIVSIFGENLAAKTEQASSLPLPKTLAGTSVTIGGMPAPLFYVSPGQINAQAPQALFIPGMAPLADVVVTTAAGSSDPIQVARQLSGLGIFTLDASGCGRAAILNVAQDGSVSMNRPANSVSPGQYLSVFGTGAFDPNTPGRVPDGQPWPVEPLHRNTGVAFLLGPLYGQADGFMAPGLVGVNQFNIHVPDNAPEGCSVPLQITDSGFSSSQTVPVSIRQGGGQCAPPPPSTAAVVEWRKSTVFSLAGQRTSETVTVDFTDDTQKTYSPEPIPLGYCILNSGRDPEGRACPPLNVVSVDAGSITAQAPSGSFTLARALVGGITRYSAELPSGTIKPGTFTVTGLGGADIGTFTSTIDVPAAIEVTSSFQPGSRIPKDQNLVVTWKGGDPNAVVRTTVRTSGGGANGYYRDDGCAALASEGVFTLYARAPHGLPLAGGPTNILVEMDPQDTAVRTFEAAGLVRGGSHRWIYEWRFEDLNIY